MTNRRQQILEAFRKRLQHYGYDKTTVAEIAADVGISVGTLYLEFRSKEDILAGLMEETTREFEAAFQEIAEAGRPPAQRLRELLQVRVAMSDRCCRQGAHSGELLLAAAERCSRVRAAKEARYLAFLESIVAEGVVAGELEAEDPAACARLLRDAIATYLPPLSLQRSSEEVGQRSAELIDLLVRGLQPRARPQLQRA